MTYTPDNWVIIKFPDHYRILAGWSGGYATGDSWRMNSGITEYTQDGDYHCFKGSSGSVYMCHKNSYCLRKNNAYMWEELQRLNGDKLQLVLERKDWYNMDWRVK